MTFEERAVIMLVLRQVVLSFVHLILDIVLNNKQSYKQPRKNFLSAIIIFHYCIMVSIDFKTTRKLERNSIKPEVFVISNGLGSQPEVKLFDRTV